MDRIMLDEKKCPHNQGFFCTSELVDGEPLAVMACGLLCGFHMNFDPEYAGRIQEAEVPRLHPWDAWKLNTVCFIYRGRHTIKKIKELSSYIE